METKGRIEYVAEAFCGKCEHSFLGVAPLGGHPTASEVLRMEGWKQTREHGWVCPACRTQEGDRG